MRALFALYQGDDGVGGDPQACWLQGNGAGAAKTAVAALRTGIVILVLRVFAIIDSIRRVRCNVL
jgi:hypothetical protein